MWLESFISNAIFWKSPIIGHFVEMMKIVEQNSTYNGSFLMWFLYTSAIVGDFVKVMKLVEEYSFENHSFLM